MSKIITIACDHAGYDLKNALKKEILNMGFEVIDCGTNSSVSVDYPDFAKLAVDNILKKKSDIAVLICGSGIGMSITANRFNGIRAALCRNANDAKLARQHNNANILALGGISEYNIHKLKLLNIKGYGGIRMFKKKPAFKRPVFIKKNFF